MLKYEGVIIEKAYLSFVLIRIIMNRLFILGLVIFLTACYSREIPTTRGLLVRGVRAYNFHSNTNYNTAEERFQDISEGGSTSNFM